MQTSKTTWILIITLLPLLLGPAVGCSGKKRQSFSEVLNKYKGTGIEQVNEAGVGVPFFSLGVLNPIWNPETKNDVIRIPKLSLIDQNGKTQTEEFFKGKITFISFIFTSCSGFCPSLVQQMKALANEIGNKRNVQYVAISVDTEFDTPEKLRAFAEKMGLATGKNWTLFTGQKEVVFSLAKNTFASQAFQKIKPGPRNFAHSEHFYVIDEDGYLRGILNGTRLDSNKTGADLVAKLANEKSFF